MSKRIVRVYYFFMCLISFSVSFFFATYVLFLTEAGLDLFQVNMVNAVFMISCFLLEVPTGAVADLYGRKVSFVIACFVHSLAFLIYYFSGSFLMFILAELVCAVGHSLHSGAFKSWMIDEVNATGEGFDLKEAYRNGQIYEGIGVMTGVVLGAYLGKIDLALPWLASSVLFFVSGILAMIFIKENMFKEEGVKKRFRDVVKIANRGILECYSNRELAFAIAFCFVMGFSLMAINMYWQLRFVELGILKENLGWVFMGISMVGMVGAHYSKTAQEFFGSNKNALIFIILLVALGMMSSALFDVLIVMMPAFYIHQLGRGMYRPIFDDYFNKRIDGRKRATMQSFCSMITMLGAFFGLITTGQIAKHISIEVSWIVSGALLFGFAMVMLSRRTRK